MPHLLTPHCLTTAPAAEWVTDAAVQQAAAQLARGALLGLPTETVYGLAADAGQPDAVQRIFQAKGRPADHPLIVHLPPDWAPGVAHHTGAVVPAGVSPGDNPSDAPHGPVPAFAWRLMRAFWPGPLTLILPRRAGVAEAAAGGQDSIGLRCPAHPAAQAVLQAAQALGVQGVAAPSANRFGRVSPTTAAHVMDEFASLDGDALMVLDGGACDVGIESTIVDATRGLPVLLRPGIVTTAQLEAVCGMPVHDPAQAALAEPAPRASGTLASHYAPNATVRLMNAASLHTALDSLMVSSASTSAPEGGSATATPPLLAVYSRQRPPPLQPTSRPGDPESVVWHAM
ncbi:MAG: L-threonylcarbamoyladenylate synthase, partial [Burkholderiales bacterium]|nr:L-threonylcarbamoyladenylate synthase [Burkholderiales bacterium]